jgi:hypothetical protein
MLKINLLALGTLTPFCFSVLAEAATVRINVNKYSGEMLLAQPTYYRIQHDVERIKRQQAEFDRQQAEIARQKQVQQWRDSIPEL